MPHSRSYHHKTVLGLAIVAALLLSVPAQADTVDVSIQSFAFNPDTIEVAFGTTVRWTNLDAVAHTSTSDSAVWDSGNLNQGQDYSFTFDSSGTFPYHCSIHPTMKGEITVRARSVPMLTPAGFVLLALLVVASALWMIRKKKVATVRR